MAAEAPRPRAVLLGLGANLGDPVRQIRRAVDRISEVVSLRALSSLYRTEPVGFRDQPDFLNLVCSGETLLPPAALHARLQAIEREMGRVRDRPNGPRLIDIDLLAHGDLVVRTDTLTLPHPRLHERAFVLAPLAEVAPDWRHPVLHKTPSEMLSALRSPSCVLRVGVLP